MGFALWARQLSLPSLPPPPYPTHIPSRSPSAVMIESPILELYLAARLVYLLGLITAPGKGRECEGVGGSEIQTDRQVIYSHLLQSFHIDLAPLHQQPNAGMPSFFFVFFSFSF